MSVLLYGYKDFMLFYIHSASFISLAAVPLPSLSCCLIHCFAHLTSRLLLPYFTLRHFGPITVHASGLTCKLQKLQGWPHSMLTMDCGSIRDVEEWDLSSGRQKSLVDVCSSNMAVVHVCYFVIPQAACVIGQQAGYKKAAVLLLLRVICLKSQNNQYETKTVTGYQRWKVIKVALSVKYLSVPTVITVTVSQVSNQYISSLSSCSFSAIAAGCIQSGHRTP